jgi:hypothetical protein
MGGAYYILNMALQCMLWIAANTLTMLCIIVAVVTGICMKNDERTLVAISGPQKSRDFQGPPFPMPRVMDLPASRPLSTSYLL